MISFSKKNIILDESLYAHGGARMIVKNWKKEVLTIPNLLSFFRLILIPVYVTIYLNATKQSDYLIAGVILAVSCLTDMIDGKIARHFNMITTVGKVLDPIADKATQITLIVCLMVRYPVLCNLIAIFVLKEGFQVLACALCYKKKRKVLKAAELAGKVSTTVLFVTLIVMVVFPELPLPVVTGITILDGLCMLVAFTDYVIVFLSKDEKFQSIDDN